MLIIWVYLAWQEPHNEQNIIEISRSTNVIPYEQHLFPLNNTETSSFMKYIHENTNVSYLSIQIFIIKTFNQSDGIEMGSFINSN